MGLAALQAGCGPSNSTGSGGPSDDDGGASTSDSGSGSGSGSSSGATSSSSSGGPASSSSSGGKGSSSSSGSGGSSSSSSSGGSSGSSSGGGCQPECTGRECGADGWGGAGGTCSSGSTCSSSTLCVANPHIVECEHGAATASGQPSTVCSCKPQDSNTGTTIYTGVTDCAQGTSIGDVAGWNEFCCASSAYPGASSSCDCYYNDTVWFCADDTTYCSCDFVTPTDAANWSNIRATTCNDVTGSDGVPWICWANDNVCSCYERNANTP